MPNVLQPKSSIYLPLWGRTQEGGSSSELCYFVGKAVSQSKKDMLQKALPASVLGFLHSPTHRDLQLLSDLAQIRPVEMTPEMIPPENPCIHIPSPCSPSYLIATEPSHAHPISIFLFLSHRYRTLLKSDIIEPSHKHIRNPLFH